MSLVWKLLLAVCAFFVLLYLLHVLLGLFVWGLVIAAVVGLIGALVSYLLRDKPKLAAPDPRLARHADRKAEKELRDLERKIKS